MTTEAVAEQALRNLQAIVVQQQTWSPPETTLDALTRLHELLLGCTAAVVTAVVADRPELRI
jgi:hypothetical protein